MTELSFLLDLLLNHKLPKATKEAITNRVKEVEIQLSKPQVLIHAPQMSTIQNQARIPIQSQQNQPEMITLANPDGTKSEIDLSKQSPATRAKLLAEAGQQPQPQTTAPPPEPVAVIAQTAAATEALNKRHEAIRIATSGKEEKGRTSPRKF